jgi:predicted DNA-binding transcriptional regulator
MILTYKESLMPSNGNDQEENIFIVKYKKESEYTTIFNDCLNDESLSTDSVAILVYVMSKPADWKINIKNISNRYSIGRDKVRNAINNLKERGYVKRVRQRNKDGSLSKILIYASDKPVFLTNPIIAEFPEENEVIKEANKQPSPEIQAVVTAEKTDKQPQPENPAPVNQSVVPYIQKKDVYKENNNNKILSNPIAGAPDAFSSEAENLYPDHSVVVVFMKKIEGMNISESTLISWLRKYGAEYVTEKIRIVKSKGKVSNPTGCLIAAIAYDWKEKAAEDAPATAQIPPALNDSPKPFPTHEENKKWFLGLSNLDKERFFEIGATKLYVLREYLKAPNKILSILDVEFTESHVFKMLMQLIGRAK